MEDAHPFVGPQGRFDQPSGHPQQPQGNPQQPQWHHQQPQGLSQQPQWHHQQPQGLQQQPQGHPQQCHPSGSGSIGTEGLASWMQQVCHHHGVDLQQLLDDSCQRALSLLTAADVQRTLEQVVEDVKRNASAMCMNRIRSLMPADRKATCNGLGPALEGSGAVSADPSPGMNCHLKPDAMDTVADTGAAHPIPAPGQLPPGADGLGANPARPALLTPVRAAAPRPSTWTLGGPPDWNTTPGLASPRLSMVPNGLPSTLNGAAPTPAAQRVLWHAPDDRCMPHAPHSAQQTGAAANSPGAGPSRQDVSRAGAASSGPGTDAGLVPEHGEVQRSIDYFGGKLLPAKMVPAGKRRLHSVVAQHHLYLTPRDFDGAILDRLANMPEHKAMKVLNEAERAKWASVGNNTRIIMFWCTRPDK